MVGEGKTKAKLVEEIYQLRSKLQEMEAYKVRYKKAEDALRQSDSFCQTFLENTGTATIIIEEDTTISMLNVEFEMVTGYARDEMVGYTWTRYVAEEDIKRLLNYHRKRR